MLLIWEVDDTLDETCWANRFARLTSIKGLLSFNPIEGAHSQINRRCVVVSSIESRE